jgi:hypothetical protein
MSMAYRINFRQGHLVVGRDDFDVDSDAGAVIVGRTLFDACSDRCSSFDLWQGERQIDPWRPRELKALGRDVTEHRQRVIAASEERLRDSRWAIASSKRLLERIENLVKESKRSADSRGESGQDLRPRNLDQEYWRRRAENARALARDMQDAGARRVLLLLADNYDLLAEKYETMASKRGTTDQEPPPGST